MAILTNGGQLLGDEYRLLRGVGPGVAELRDDLDTMSALLVMQSEAGDDRRRRRGPLRPGVDEPAPRARLRRRRLHRPLQAPHHVQADRRRAPPPQTPPRHAPRAPPPRRRHRRPLRPRRRHRGPPRAVRRRRPRRSPPAPPLCFVIPCPSSSARAGRWPCPAAHDPQRHHQHPVGIEDQAKTLAEKLVVVVNGESRGPMVLSIVGFGGLGKTTLAKEVCRRVEAEFPY